MLISILIANYNNSKYIVEALQSIYEQTYQNWEVVIVDDASTDNSLQVIEPYLQDSRIKLVSNEKNYGCGYTKKRCLEEAIGVYCGFLDPDDALTPDALDVMIREHQRRPEAGLIHSKCFYCDADLNITDEGLYAKDVHNKGSYLLHEEGGVTHFVTFSLDKYRSTVGLSAEFTKAVDQDLYYLLDETGAFYFVDKALYYYRIHEGGISTNNNIIPAAFQHFKVKLMTAERRLRNPRFYRDRYKLNRLIARCRFHLSVLERHYFAAPIYLINYYLKGGRTEIMNMFGRLFLHPKRVVNTIFKIYKVD